MKIKPFKLERYFAKYEFSAPYLLCSSDCEALSMDQLLQISDPDSLKLWNNLKLEYTESLGHPLLREEVSRLYQSITPNDVMILTPEEGIFIAINNILEPGDHMISTFPGYQSLYEIGNSIGAEISQWRPKEDNRWFFDPNDLKDLIKENTKLIVINFPHNPTGATLSQSELEQVVEIATVNNIIIFSDEMYRFLEHNPADCPPAICDIYDNGISLFGMSKTFSLPGLRIGWLASKNKDLFSRFATYKDYTTICNNAPGEILSIMALRSKDKIIKRNLDMMMENLEILDIFFLEYAHLFEWHRPTAGPIGFPRLKNQQNIAEFCLDLNEKKGVLLLPANQYDFKGNNFRLSFARKNMPEALSKFQEYIDQYYKSKEIF